MSVAKPGDPVLDKNPEAVSTDTRPQQFRMTEAWLHGERDRVMALAQDWRPSHSRDIRDSRSAQLLGETLLRMQPSLGMSLVERHDLLESWRSLGGSDFV